MGGWSVGGAFPRQPRQARLQSRATEHRPPGVLLASLKLRRTALPAARRVLPCRAVMFGAQRHALRPRRLCIRHPAAPRVPQPASTGARACVRAFVCACVGGWVGGWEGGVTGRQAGGPAGGLAALRLDPGPLPPAARLIVPMPTASSPRFLPCATLAPPAGAVPDHRRRQGALQPKPACRKSHSKGQACVCWQRGDRLVGSAAPACVLGPAWSTLVRIVSHRTPLPPAPLSACPACPAPFRMAWCA